MTEVIPNSRIKASEMRPGDLIRPAYPATWFPVDYETMDVWRPKEWMLQSCEFFEEDRRPLVYVGMVSKRVRSNTLWTERMQQGRHMVYYEGSIYFITPNAWKFMERLNEPSEEIQTT